MRSKKDIKANIPEEINSPVQMEEQTISQMHTGQTVQRMSESTTDNQMHKMVLDEKPKGKIVNGGPIEEALNSTTYGKKLIDKLINSGLEYRVNLNGFNGGKFGDPKKIKEGDKEIWELNFQKYKKSNLWGTRFDHASKTEYYGAIGAHDIIDTATPEGEKVNKQKIADAGNPESEYMKKYKAWKTAKDEDEATAKVDFFQYLIDNYEQVGMNAELKFRESLSDNTLDVKIGKLQEGKQTEDLNPDLVGKTPREVYTKGVK